MNIFLVVLVITFISLNVNAQSVKNKDLFSLYENNDFDKLKSQLQKINENQKGSSEIQFLEAVFLENGEDALSIYLKLFDSSYGDFKKIISKKLSDYYYAKGYYLTSSKYQKYMVENTNSNASKNKNIEKQVQQRKYIIQLGAFGLKENANQLKEMLQTQNLYTRIEIRDIKGKQLYCVWLDGKKGFSETLDFAEKIKEKYHLQYRILQQ